MNEEPAGSDQDSGVPTSGTGDTGSPGIEHANQLRGEKFKQLVGRPVAYLPIAALSLVALVGFAAAGMALVGLAAAVIAGLVGLVVVFVIADQQAEDAFYDAYCASHGLTRVRGESIGRLTPLLRKGDRRKTDEIFRGTLAEGVEGDIVLFTYTVVTEDSKGNDSETDYPFSLIHVEMPEIREFLPELRVQNQFGFKFLEGFEDKFRLSHERVTLESEAIRDRYEIFVQKGQDAVWVRRLFSPSFIVWLTEQPPRKFAFELEDGHLVAYVPKHCDDVEGLEELTRTGAHVATRLLTELAESSRRPERETTA